MALEQEKEPTIAPGDPIPKGGCHRLVQGVPFGPLKAEDNEAVAETETEDAIEEGEFKVLAMNYEEKGPGSLAHTPTQSQEGLHGSADDDEVGPTHTRKEHILRKHAEDGVQFCPYTDADGASITPLCQHAPLICRIGPPIQIEFDVITLEQECTDWCREVITKGRMGLTEAQLEFARGVYPEIAVFEREGETFLSPYEGVSGGSPENGEVKNRFSSMPTEDVGTPIETSSVGWSLMLPTYKIQIQLKLDPKKAVTSAWDYLEDMTFTVRGIWLKGPVSLEAAESRFDDMDDMTRWLKSATTDTEPRESRGGRIFVGTANSPFWVHGAPTFESDIPVGPMQCSGVFPCANGATIGLLHRFTPRGFSCGVDEEGEPIPIAYNNPRVNIPEEVWFPES